MSMVQELTNLEGLLDRIGNAARDLDRVTLGAVVEAIGSRAFGPLLVMVGIILVSPLSGIPGVPTTMGIVVMLIAMQLLLRRKKFWLPDWLLRRSIARNRLDKSIAWLRTPACFIDRWLRPRLTILTRGFGVFPIPIICIIIAVSLPVMELVPFSATSAGFILTAFGLSLISHDGFLALVAFILTAITFVFVVYYFL